jgi:hypothetical protein
MWRVIVQRLERPLWSVSDHPRKSRLITCRTETCEIRRLPGTFRRVAVLWLSYPCPTVRSGGRDIALGNSREPLVCHPRWTFFALGRIHWASDTHSKAAPLQALGDHPSHQPSALFEDDDEDEYDYEPSKQPPNVGYNEGGPAITRFPFQRPSLARKSLMTPPAA